MAGLEPGMIVSLKEALGGETDACGVRVNFLREDTEQVRLDIYPLVVYGYILPDVAWQIQEQVKDEVERYTGLLVNEVNVQVTGIVEEEHG